MRLADPYGLTEYRLHRGRRPNRSLLEERILNNPMNLHYRQIAQLY